MKLEMAGDYLHLTFEEGDKIRITQEDNRLLTVRTGDNNAPMPETISASMIVEVESE